MAGVVKWVWVTIKGYLNRFQGHCELIVFGIIMDTQYKQSSLTLSVSSTRATLILGMVLAAVVGGMSRVMATSQATVTLIISCRAICRTLCHMPHLLHLWARPLVLQRVGSFHPHTRLLNHRRLSSKYVIVIQVDLRVLAYRIGCIANNSSFPFISITSRYPFEL